MWQQLNAFVDAPGGDWPVVCVAQPGINAYVDHSDHLVAIHRGVQRLTEDETAAILAHERAHLALGHAPPRGRATREPDQEDEADALGVIYMRLAGYNPVGAIKLEGRFKQTPAGRNRRRRLEADIKTANALVPSPLDERAARRLGVLMRYRISRSGD